MRVTSLQRVSRGQYNFREHVVGIVQQSIEGSVDSELNTPQDNSQMTGQMGPSRLEFNPRPSLLLDSNHCAILKMGKNNVETPLCQFIEGEPRRLCQCHSKANENVIS